MQRRCDKMAPNVHSLDMHILHRWLMAFFTPSLKHKFNILFQIWEAILFYSQFNHVENIKCQQVLLLFYLLTVTCFWTSQVGLVVKNPPAYEGDKRDMGLILGLGRPPGGGHGNPLQYCFLENPMDREAWKATIHRLTMSWIWLNKNLALNAFLMWSFYIQVNCPCTSILRLNLTCKNRSKLFMQINIIYKSYVQIPM